MGRKWWWVRSPLVWLGSPLLGALLLYATLFLRSMYRHGWALDHLSVLLFVWQTQTAAAFALFAALIGAGALHHQTLAAQRREELRRHRERTTVAAALLAEITSILSTFEEHKVVETYRQVQQVMQQATQSGAALPGADAPTFRVTVYEKCADRIGMLAKDEAVAVVRFYGFLTGYRNAVNRAYNAGLPMQDRISTLEFLNSGILPVELPRAKDLQSKLAATVARGVGAGT